MVRFHNNNKAQQAAPMDLSYSKPHSSRGSVWPLLFLFPCLFLSQIPHRRQARLQPANFAVLGGNGVVLHFQEP